MSITPEELLKIEERKTAGRSGKLFSIECYCKVGAAERRHVLRNRYGNEIMHFRKEVFSIGIMLPIEPPKEAKGAEAISWEIVHPNDIITIVVTRQSNYFNE